MSDVAPRPADQQQPRWQPLSAIDRRVVGVLVEKAKTTPDAYPMSVNALRSGCNQKNNRVPLMDLEIEDIEESLARLRAAGAVSEVQGGGRISRYRHYMYEWLGVDKVELGVMAELLLRGAQTEGELRGRAARMDPITDVSALRPILGSLKAKKLVLSLTPEGRGHIVTHALYEPRELEKVRAEAHAVSTASDTQDMPRHPAADVGPAARQSAQPPRTAPHSPPQLEAATTSYATRQSVDEVRQELETLRAQYAALRKDLDDLWSNFR